MSAPAADAIINRAPSQYSPNSAFKADQYTTSALPNEQPDENRKTNLYSFAPASKDPAPTIYRNCGRNP